MTTKTRAFLVSFLIPLAIVGLMFLIRNTEWADVLFYTLIFPIVFICSLILLPLSTGKELRVYSWYGVLLSLVLVATLDILHFYYQLF